MRIVRATAVTAAVAAASAVFGLAREMVVAATFGADRSTEAFFFASGLAVRFPEFLVPAITASLIPLYLKAESSEARANLVNTVVTLFAIVFTVLTGLAYFGSPLIIETIGRGFSPSEGALAATMLAILSPAVTLLGGVAILKALLEAEGRFFVSQVSQVFGSLGVIGAIVLLASRLDAFSMAVGVTGAAFVQIAWVMLWLRRSGIRITPSLSLRHPEVARFARLLWPGLIGAAILWIIPLVDQALATQLSAGGVSALSYGGRAVGVVERIGIQSLVVVGLPVFSWRAANLDRSTMAASVEDTLGAVFFVMTPASLLLVALRLPITRLLFERGAFEASATQLTSTVLAAYALGLAPAALAVTISTVFKALEDTRTPAVYGAGVNLLSKAILSPLLLIPLGAPGLALASSIMYAISSVVLVGRLVKSGVEVQHRRLFAHLSRIGGLSLVVMVPGFLLATLIDWPDAALVALVFLVTTVLYLAGARILSLPELDHLRRVDPRRGRVQNA